MTANKSLFFTFEDIEVREREFSIIKAGEVIQLEPKAFRVLLIFLRNPRKLLTKEELLNAVWGDTAVTENSLARAIAVLRRALGDDSRDPRYIETVSTVGYRFLSQVDAAEAPSDTHENGVGPTFIATVPPKEYRFNADVEANERDGHGLADVAPRARRSRRLLTAIASISALGLVVVTGIVIWNSRPRELRVAHVTQLTNDAKSKLPTNPSVTDGVHLYFVEGTQWAGGSGISQVSVTGGETTRLVTEVKDIYAIFDIAPDYSELLVGGGVTQDARGGLEVWAQPLPAGTPHRVGNIVATDASYTPDGSQILYSDGHSLITINRDGGNAHLLARVEGIVRRIHFSPDRKRVRFDIATEPFDVSSIWEIAADGGNAHRLLPDWKEGTFQCCGNWSPDGKYYFFQARHNNDQAIWALSERRPIFGSGQGNPSRLIAGPLRLSVPVPSRDGKRLFIVGEELRVEPQRFDKKTHSFESYMNGMSILSFEVSPDGKWMAYVSYPERSLWRSRVDGAEKMQLTFPPVRVFNPRWSPDGSQIAFTDTRFDRAFTVGLVSSSGGPPQTLQGAEPNWLPGGKSIIYSGFKPGTNNVLELFSRNLETGNIAPIHDSENKFSPRVSPDGRYLSAFSFAAPTELWVFDLNTGRWSSLAKGESSKGESFGYNLWSHDGKYIYMHDIQNGSPRIVRLSLRNKEMEEVVDLKDFPQPAGRLVNWFGLTPDGDPVVIRDLSTQEIYALDLE